MDLTLVRIIIVINVCICSICEDIKGLLCENT